jgi:hypothetical protein
MIHDMNDSILSFDDAAREGEWLAQENAMRRERLHLDPRNDDARTQRYRLLARALRQAPDEGLPPDFAQQVAAQLASSRRTSPDARVEFGLVIVLCLAMLAGAIVVTARYGSAWLHTVFVLPSSAASSWHLLLALSACVAFTWLLGRRRPSAKDG